MSDSAGSFQPAGPAAGTHDTLPCATGEQRKRAARHSARRPIHHAAPPDYSCAGNGSIVSASTGTWTSSRYGEVILKTCAFGKASMNCA